MQSGVDALYVERATPPPTEESAWIGTAFFSVVVTAWPMLLVGRANLDSGWTWLWLILAEVGAVVLWLIFTGHSTERAHPTHVVQERLSFAAAGAPNSDHVGRVECDDESLSPTDEPVVVAIVRGAGTSFGLWTPRALFELPGLDARDGERVVELAPAIVPWLRVERVQASDERAPLGCLGAFLALLLLLAEPWGLVLFAPVSWPLLIGLLIVHASVYVIATRWVLARARRECARQFRELSLKLDASPLA